MLGKFIAVAAIAVSMAGCGYTTGDRAISGGAIGAGTGAAAAAITGGNLLTGSLIGAGVGAAAGGLTSSRDVNLGCPWWRNC